MAEIRPIGRSPTAAHFVLGSKLDSIPFSAYHTMLIAVLALVGFVEGYGRLTRISGNFWTRDQLDG